jgi:sec-independent protein translocase protein TatA
MSSLVGHVPLVAASPPSTLPLFGGLPGGPELLVLVLLLVVLLAVPVLVFVFVFRTVSDRPNYEERISDLEREVEALRARLDDADDESTTLDDVEFPERDDGE